MWEVHATPPPITRRTPTRSSNPADRLITVRLIRCMPAPTTRTLSELPGPSCRRHCRTGVVVAVWVVVLRFEHAVHASSECGRGTGGKNAHCHQDNHRLPRARWNRDQFISTSPPRRRGPSEPWNIACCRSGTSGTARVGFRRPTACAGALTVRLRFTYGAGQTGQISPTSNRT